MSTPRELRIFGNALRAYLELDPLWDDGRDKQREKARTDTERFYVDPVCDSRPIWEQRR
jgi:hypothetical protein